MSQSPTSTLDRRSFIKAAGRFGKTAAAGSLLSLGPLMPRSPARSQAKALTSEPLIQPVEIRSANGILDATLTAAPGPVRIGEHTVSGLLYSGTYVPPTLRARLGDTLRITFRNNLLDKPSNLHYHGMSVSPQGNSDNVSSTFTPAKHFNTRCASQRSAGKALACSGTIRTHTASSTIKSSAACRAHLSSTALRNFSHYFGGCRNVSF
jgi:FtsP/CotA-like multicopper oxidase with cupredoxin domain